MALYLEIISGPLKGTRKKVAHGLVIGRKEGDLTIQDSKLSSKHAKIEKRADGSFWMVDLGSSNGIKQGEERLRRLQLTPGAQFTLGRTSFTVGEDPAAVELGDESVIDFEESAAQPEPAQPKNSWDHLKELTEKAGREVKNIPCPVLAFSPPLRLKFTRGLQIGAEWTVGYGPRVAGSQSTDLTFEDPRLPEICFRLVPHGDDILLRCESPAHIRLNGRNVVAEVLRHGDVIDVATTQLQVHFDE